VRNVWERPMFCDLLTLSTEIFVTTFCFYFFHTLCSPGKFLWQREK
jgi:hypothetical protein